MELNAGCNNDYVEIQDGGLTVARFCGDKCSDSFVIVAASSATIVFHSDGNAVVGLFKIRFWAVSTGK